MTVQTVPEPIVKPPSTPPWVDEAAEKRHHGVMTAFHHLTAACHEIARLVAANAPREPLGQTRTLNALNPWNVDRKGYRYLRVWFNSSATVTIDVGAGPTTVAVAAGWNNVDWPQETKVTCAANPGIYVQLTDYYPPAQ